MTQIARYLRNHRGSLATIIKMLSFLINGIVWTIAIYFGINELLKTRDNFLPTIRDIRSTDVKDDQNDQLMAIQRYQV